MDRYDQLVIFWHRVRGHQSAFSMNEKSWLCQCGEKRGQWSPTH